MNNFKRSRSTSFRLQNFKQLRFVPRFNAQILSFGEFAAGFFTGEQKMGKQLGVHWISCGDGFTWDSEDLAHDKQIAADGWAQAKALLAAGQHQLVIFDELTYLASFGWLDIQEILEPIRQRPRHVNVIVTGRDAHPDLLELADTVTDMTEVKHAYTSGIRAMRGIDF